MFDLVHGGRSYDPAGVILQTQAHILLILGACAISFVGAYMQYFGAIKNGFRDRTHSIPLICNLWFFAHDTTYIVNFNHWFFAVDFWLSKAFWFALVVFAACESIVTYQILRFSRTDLFPGMTLPQAVVVYCSLQLFAYGLFWWLQSMIKDPYYYLSFSTTVILAPLLNIPMMRARGSQRGFSLFMLYGFFLLTIGFWIWMFLSDIYFEESFFWLIAIGNIAISIAGIVEFRRQLPYHPAEGKLYP